MSVTPWVPPSLTWLYDLVVGQEWPLSDEDGLYAIAQAWAAAKTDLASTADSGNAVAANVNYTVQANSTDAFNAYWQKFEAHLGDLSQQAGAIGTFMQDAATKIEYTKWAINFQFAILAAQAVIDLALVAFTDGISLTELLLGATLARQWIVRLIADLIAGILMTTLPDLIAQGIQILEGHRGGLDMGQLGSDALTGSLMGLAMFGVGTVAGPVLKWLTDMGVGKGLARFGVGTAGGAVMGASVNEAMYWIDAAVNPDANQGKTPVTAALSGALSGGLLGAAFTGIDLGGGAVKDAVTTGDTTPTYGAGPNDINTVIGPNYTVKFTNDVPTTDTQQPIAPAALLAYINNRVLAGVPPDQIFPAETLQGSASLGLGADSPPGITSWAVPTKDGFVQFTPLGLGADNTPGITSWAVQTKDGFIQFTPLHDSGTPPMDNSGAPQPSGGNPPPVSPGGGGLVGGGGGGGGGSAASTGTGTSSPSTSMYGSDQAAAGGNSTGPVDYFQLNNGVGAQALALGHVTTLTYDVPAFSDTQGNLSVFIPPSQPGDGPGVGPSGAPVYPGAFHTDDNGVIHLNVLPVEPQGALVPANPPWWQAQPPSLNADPGNRWGGLLTGQQPLALPGPGPEALPTAPADGLRVTLPAATNVPMQGAPLPGIPAPAASGAAPGVAPTAPGSEPVTGPSAAQVPSSLPNITVSPAPAAATIPTAATVPTTAVPTTAEVPPVTTAVSATATPALAAVTPGVQQPLVAGASPQSVAGAGIAAGGQVPGAPGTETPARALGQANIGQANVGQAGAPGGTAAARGAQPEAFHGTPAAPSPSPIRPTTASQGTHSQGTHSVIRAALATPQATPQPGTYQPGTDQPGTGRPGTAKPDGQRPGNAPTPTPDRNRPPDALPRQPEIVPVPLELPSPTTGEWSGESPGEWWTQPPREWSGDHPGEWSGEFPWEWSAELPAELPDRSAADEPTGDDPASDDPTGDDPTETPLAPGEALPRTPAPAKLPPMPGDPPPPAVGKPLPMPGDPPSPAPAKPPPLPGDPSPPATGPSVRDPLGVPGGYPWVTREPMADPPSRQEPPPVVPLLPGYTRGDDESDDGSLEVIGIPLPGRDGVEILMPFRRSGPRPGQPWVPQVDPYAPVIFPGFWPHRQTVIAVIGPEGEVYYTRATPESGLWHLVDKDGKAVGVGVLEDGILSIYGPQQPEEPEEKAPEDPEARKEWEAARRKRHQARRNAPFAGRRKLLRKVDLRGRALHVYEYHDATDDSYVYLPIGKDGTFERELGYRVVERTTAPGESVKVRIEGLVAGAGYTPAEQVVSVRKVTEVYDLEGNLRETRFEAPDPVVAWMHGETAAMRQTFPAGAVLTVGADGVLTGVATKNDTTTITYGRVADGPTLHKTGIEFPGPDGAVHRFDITDANRTRLDPITTVTAQATATLDITWADGTPTTAANVTHLYQLRDADGTIAESIAETAEPLRIPQIHDIYYLPAGSTVVLDGNGAVVHVAPKQLIWNRDGQTFANQPAITGQPLGQPLGQPRQPEQIELLGSDGRPIHQPRHILGRDGQPIRQPAEPPRLLDRNGQPLTSTRQPRPVPAMPLGDEAHPRTVLTRIQDLLNNLGIPLGRRAPARTSPIHGLVISDNPADRLAAPNIPHAPGTFVLAGHYDPAARSFTYLDEHGTPVLVPLDDVVDLLRSLLIGPGHTVVVAACQGTAAAKEITLALGANAVRTGGVVLQRSDGTATAAYGFDENGVPVLGDTADTEWVLEANPYFDPGTEPVPLGHDLATALTQLGYTPAPVPRSRRRLAADNTGHSMYRWGSPRPEIVLTPAPAAELAARSRRGAKRGGNYLSEMKLDTASTGRLPETPEILQTHRDLVPQEEMPRYTANPDDLLDGSTKLFSLALGPVNVLTGAPVDRTAVRGDIPILDTEFQGMVGLLARMMTTRFSRDELNGIHSLADLVAHLDWVRDGRPRSGPWWGPFRRFRTGPARKSMWAYEYGISYYPDVGPHGSVEFTVGTTSQIEPVDKEGWVLAHSHSGGQEEADYRSWQDVLSQRSDGLSWGYLVTHAETGTDTMAHVWTYEDHGFIRETPLDEVRTPSFKNPGLRISGNGRDSTIGALLREIHAEITDVETAIQAMQGGETSVLAPGESLVARSRALVARNTELVARDRTLRKAREQLRILRHNFSYGETARAEDALSYLWWRLTDREPPYWLREAFAVDPDEAEDWFRTSVLVRLIRAFEWLPQLREEYPELAAAVDGDRLSALLAELSAPQPEAPLGDADIALLESAVGAVTLWKKHVEDILRAGWLPPAAVERAAKHSGSAPPHPGSTSHQMTPGQITRSQNRPPRGEPPTQPLPFSPQSFSPQSSSPQSSRQAAFGEAVRASFVDAARRETATRGGSVGGSGRTAPIPVITDVDGRPYLVSWNATAHGATLEITDMAVWPLTPGAGGELGAGIDPGEPSGLSAARAQAAVDDLPTLVAPFVDLAARFNFGALHIGSTPVAREAFPPLFAQAAPPRPADEPRARLTYPLIAGAGSVTALRAESEDGTWHPSTVPDAYRMLVNWPGLQDQWRDMGWFWRQRRKADDAAMQAPGPLPGQAPAADDEPTFSPHAPTLILPPTASYDTRPIPAEDEFTDRRAAPAPPAPAPDDRPVWGWDVADLPTLPGQVAQQLAGQFPAAQQPVQQPAQQPAPPPTKPGPTVPLPELPTKPGITAQIPDLPTQPQHAVGPAPAQKPIAPPPPPVAQQGHPPDVADVPTRPQQPAPAAQPQQPTRATPTQQPTAQQPTAQQPTAQQPTAQQPTAQQQFPPAVLLPPSPVGAATPLPKWIEEQWAHQTGAMRQSPLDAVYERVRQQIELDEVRLKQRDRVLKKLLDTRNIYMRERDPDWDRQINPKWKPSRRKPPNVFNGKWAREAAEAARRLELLEAEATRALAPDPVERSMDDAIRQWFTDPDQAEQAVLTARLKRRWDGVWRSKPEERNEQRINELKGRLRQLAHLLASPDRLVGSADRQAIRNEIANAQRELARIRDRATRQALEADLKRRAAEILAAVKRGEDPLKNVIARPSALDVFRQHSVPAYVEPGHTKPASDPYKALRETVGANWTVTGQLEGARLRRPGQAAQGPVAFFDPSKVPGVTVDYRSNKGRWLKISLTAPFLHAPPKATVRSVTRFVLSLPTILVGSGTRSQERTRVVELLTLPGGIKLRIVTWGDRVQWSHRTFFTGLFEKTQLWSDAGAVPVGEVPIPMPAAFRDWLKHEELLNTPFGQVKVQGFATDEHKPVGTGYQETVQRDRVVVTVLEDPTGRLANGWTGLRPAYPSVTEEGPPKPQNEIRSGVKFSFKKPVLPIAQLPLLLHTLFPHLFPHAHALPLDPTAASDLGLNFKAELALGPKFASQLMFENVADQIRHANTVFEGLGKFLVLPREALEAKLTLSFEAKVLPDAVAGLFGQGLHGPLGDAVKILSEDYEPLKLEINGEIDVGHLFELLASLTGLDMNALLAKTHLNHDKLVFLPPKKAPAHLPSPAPTSPSAQPLAPTPTNVPGPAQSAPAQALPTQTLPGQTLPTQALPAQALPAQTTGAPTTVQPTPRQARQAQAQPHPAPTANPAAAPSPGAPPTVSMRALAHGHGIVFPRAPGEADAADLLPYFPGYFTVVGHFNQAGELELETGHRLTPDQLYDMLPGLGRTGESLLLVGCYSEVAAGRIRARALADGHPVATVASDTTVVQLGETAFAMTPAFAADGTPLLTQPRPWVYTAADGAAPRLLDVELASAMGRLGAPPVRRAPQPRPVAPARPVRVVWSGGGVYSTDPRLLDDAYAGVAGRLRQGRPAVPFLPDVPSGPPRSFALQIEFQLTGKDSTRPLERLADMLEAAGLAMNRNLAHGDSSRQMVSHSEPDAWYVNGLPGTGGSVISPVLYDTPETRRVLARVLAMIKKVGGTAGGYSGLHIHVNAADYTDDPAKYFPALLSLVKEHEDSLYRLAVDPTAPERRVWTRPANVATPIPWRPALGFSADPLAAVEETRLSRHAAISLTSPRTADRNWVGFHLWEASLDPGIVQAQIAVSTGLVEAGHATPWLAGGAVHSLSEDPLGAHLTAGQQVAVTAKSRKPAPWSGSGPGGVGLSAVEPPQRTTSFRRLLDLMPYDEAVLDQIASLFAVNRWQRLAARRFGLTTEQHDAAVVAVVGRQVLADAPFKPGTWRSLDWRDVLVLPDDPSAVAAAGALPDVEGAVVIGTHVFIEETSDVTAAPVGGSVTAVAVGDQVVPPIQAVGIIRAALAGAAPGTPLVLVGCDAYLFGAMLRSLLGVDVIAADRYVWQLPGGAIVVGDLEFDPSGTGLPPGSAPWWQGVQDAVTQAPDAGAVRPLSAGNWWLLPRDDSPPAALGPELAHAIGRVNTLTGSNLTMTPRPSSFTQTWQQVSPGPYHWGIGTPWWQRIPDLLRHPALARGRPRPRVAPPVPNWLTEMHLDAARTGTLPETPEHVQRRGDVALWPQEEMPPFDPLAAYRSWGPLRLFTIELGDRNILTGRRVNRSAIRGNIPLLDEEYRGLIRLQARLMTTRFHPREWSRIHSPADLVAHLDRVRRHPRTGPATEPVVGFESDIAYYPDHGPFGSVGMAVGITAVGPAALGGWSLAHNHSGGNEAADYRSPSDVFYLRGSGLTAGVLVTHAQTGTDTMAHVWTYEDHGFLREIPLDKVRTPSFKNPDFQVGGNNRTTTIGARLREINAEYSALVDQMLGPLADIPTPQAATIALRTADTIASHLLGWAEVADIPGLAAVRATLGPGPEGRDTVRAADATVIQDHLFAVQRAVSAEGEQLRTYRRIFSHGEIARAEDALSYLWWQLLDIEPLYWIREGLATLRANIQERLWSWIIDGLTSAFEWMPGLREEYPVLAAAVESDRFSFVGLLARLSDPAAEYPLGDADIDLMESAVGALTLWKKHVEDIVRSGRLPPPRVAESTEPLRDPTSEQVTLHQLTPRHGPGYAANPDWLKDVYQRTATRLMTGRPAVPFHPDTTKYAWRRFTLRIEFHLTESQKVGKPLQGRTGVLGRLREALRDAGLGGKAVVPRYLWEIADAGEWWVAELPTGGMVISPELTWTPTTWRTVEKALTMIRKVGGAPSGTAGLRVAVDTSEFLDDPATYYGAFKSLVKEHEDVLYRLAAYPASESDRVWMRHEEVAKPIPWRPSRGYSRLAPDNEVSVDAIRFALAHDLAIGLPDAYGDEWTSLNLWEASLDPGIVQAQVDVSMGLVYAGRHSPWLRREAIHALPEEILGWHLSTGDQVPVTTRSLLPSVWYRPSLGPGIEENRTWQRVGLSAAEPPHRTASFRRLLDLLPVDTEQVTALFAVNRWQGHEDSQFGLRVYDQMPRAKTAVPVRSRAFADPFANRGDVRALDWRRDVLLLSDDPVDIAAAAALPDLDGAVAVVTHTVTDDHGNVTGVFVGDRAVPPEQAIEVIRDALGVLPTGTPIVLIGCRSLGFARMIRDALGTDMIAADRDVWQFPNGAIVAADLPFDPHGLWIFPDNEPWWQEVQDAVKWAPHDRAAVEPLTAGRWWYVPSDRHDTEVSLGHELTPALARFSRGLAFGVNQVTVTPRDRAFTHTWQRGAPGPRRWGADDAASYLARPKLLDAAYEQVARRLDTGEEPVPYRTVDATGGMAAPGTGRTFGLRVQFAFPHAVTLGPRRAALNRITAQLEAEGLGQPAPRFLNPRFPGMYTRTLLTRGPTVDDAADAWRVVADHVNVFELVSPLLYDTPETWDALPRIIDIVTANGGVTTPYTRMFTYVSTADFTSEAFDLNYAALVDLGTAFEAPLFRLGADPFQDRSAELLDPVVPYELEPNPWDAGFPLDLDLPIDMFAHNGPYPVNLEPVFSRDGSHVEFGFWTTSTHPGVLQAQINLSLALTETAAAPPRTDSAGYHVLPTTRGEARLVPEPLGSHAARRGPRPATRRAGVRISPREPVDDTAGLRRLLDLLPESVRDQAAALAAVTWWHERWRAGRSYGADVYKPEPTLMATALATPVEPGLLGSVHDAIRARVAAGRPALEYVTRDATGGLGSPSLGRPFAVELELVFRGVRKDASTDPLERLAQALYDAGLSDTPMVFAGHDVTRTDHRRDTRAWRVETDLTVGGEVISPILYDTPETWAALEEVLEIIRADGGTVSFAVSGHISVGIADYGREDPRLTPYDNPGDRLSHYEAAMLTWYKTLEDVLFRLTANPRASRHRGLGHAALNVWRPGEGFVLDDIDWAAHANHKTAVNLQHVRGSRTDRAEFRLVDGSLDKAVIQAQIIAALAVTNAGRYHPGIADGRIFSLPADPLGGHLARYGQVPVELTTPDGLALSVVEPDARTETLRTLLHLIPDPDARRRVTALFLVNRWQADPPQDQTRAARSVLAPRGSGERVRRAIDHVTAQLAERPGVVTLATDAASLAATAAFPDISGPDVSGAVVVTTHIAPGGDGRPAPVGTGDQLLTLDEAVEVLARTVVARHPETTVILVGCGSVQLADALHAATGADTAGATRDAWQFPQAPHHVVAGDLAFDPDGTPSVPGDRWWYEPRQPDEAGNPAATAAGSLTFGAWRLFASDGVREFGPDLSELLDAVGALAAPPSDATRAWQATATGPFRWAGGSHRPPASYRRNPRLLDADHAATAERLRIGRAPVPFDLSDLPAARTTRKGERFTLDIGFGFAPGLTADQRRAVLDQTLRALESAGLVVPYDPQVAFHSSRTTGDEQYARGSWRLVGDLAGPRLISPVLANEVDGWVAVERALRTIAAGGGVTGPSAVTTVSVTEPGTAEPAWVAAAGSEDTLARLASDPGAGSPYAYRGVGITSRPNPSKLDSLRGKEPVAKLVDWRTATSFDPGTVRARVAALLGLRRLATSKRSPLPPALRARPARDRLGDHAGNAPWARPAGAGVRVGPVPDATDTAVVRDILDALADRGEQEQVAALFSITSWQPESTPRTLFDVATYHPDPDLLGRDRRAPTSPGALAAVHEDIALRMLTGQAVLEAVPSDATGGLGSPSSGRPFRLVVRFLSNGMQPRGLADPHRADMGTLLDRIAAALIEDPVVTGPPTAGPPVPDTDPTWHVALENQRADAIVSPWMFDTPDGWRRAEAAIEVLRAHGVTPAGLTVEVAAGDYGGDTPWQTSPFKSAEKRTGHYLAAFESLFAGHLGALWRLCTDPTVRSRRVLWSPWASPSIINEVSPPFWAPGEGYPRVPGGFNGPVWESGLDMNDLAVSVSHATDPVEPRIAVSLWDGSFDLAIVQTWVAVSLGLVHAARYHPIVADGQVFSLPQDKRDTRAPAGVRLVGPDGLSLSHSEPAQPTASFRRLLRLVLPDDEALRRRVMTLFALNDWSHFAGAASHGPVEERIDQAVREAVHGRAVSRSHALVIASGYALREEMREAELPFTDDVVLLLTRIGPDEDGQPTVVDPGGYDFTLDEAAEVVRRSLTPEDARRRTVVIVGCDGELLAETLAAKTPAAKTPGVKAAGVKAAGADSEVWEFPGGQVATGDLGFDRYGRPLTPERPWWWQRTQELLAAGADSQDARSRDATPLALGAWWLHDPAAPTRRRLGTSLDGTLRRLSRRRVRRVRRDPRSGNTSAGITTPRHYGASSAAPDGRPEPREQPGPGHDRGVPPDRPTPPRTPIAAALGGFGLPAPETPPDTAPDTAAGAALPSDARPPEAGGVRRDGRITQALRIERGQV